MLFSFIRRRSYDVRIHSGKASAAARFHHARLWHSRLAARRALAKIRPRKADRRADEPEDLEGQAQVAAFAQGLQEAGWAMGRNVQIDIRWGADEIKLERTGAAELLALAPDLIFANGTLSVAALQHAGYKKPIVFVGVTDPIGAGFVDDLARPGGNITGFMIYEYSFGGKRLELLKQIAPNVTRVSVLRDPKNPGSSAEFAAIQALAQSLGVEVRPINSHQEAAQVERAIATFANSPTAVATLRRETLVPIMAQHKLPAVYPFRYQVSVGGLASIGPHVVAQCRLAAAYADRVLKGEKPGDLPVQAPTKYEIVINQSQDRKSAGTLVCHRLC